MKHELPDAASDPTRIGLLDRVIRVALARRRLVLGAAIALFGFGAYWSDRLTVDVFPDLNRPVVTVLAEARGLAATEVESLLAIPLESAMLGAPGVKGVRSHSKRGIAMLRVEFDWGADIYRCRQIVVERIAAAQATLPPNARPALGPITSIMGEILLIGLTADDLREVRDFAEWKLRRRLLALPGVSNITILGGEARVYEVAVNAADLAAKNLGLVDMERALSGTGANTGGGFFERDGREFAFRNLASIYELDEISQATVGFLAGGPVRAGDVAKIREGALPPRGSAGVDGRPGVIVAVQKQPGASTLDLSERITAELARIRDETGPDIQIHGELFRQADFIERAIDNVIEAMRDGSIIVALVLGVFLWNLRTTAITLLALPLSLLAGVLALSALGFGVNTMTLGGLAVAVGELVDDAIVDVENCFRRLRENALLATPRPALDIVFEASSEIRNSIALATLVVVLVFVPLFFLDGVAGRLFQPLAAAYILTILASLAVALTVTPVLCYYLLPSGGLRRNESALVRWLKNLQAKNLRRIIARPLVPVSAALLAFALALAVVPFLNRTFLPDFNEGTLTVEALTATGTSLRASEARAAEIERILLNTPGVERVARRTGRAEMDEHAEGVHYSEFDVSLDPGIRGAERSALLAGLRNDLGQLQGVSTGIGQPISHRLDHLLSGVRSEVAVLIRGRDIDQLQYAAFRAREILTKIPGVADLRVEAASFAPEYKIAVDHRAAGRLGLAAPAIVRSLETAQSGRLLGRVQEEGRFVPVMLRLDAESRSAAAMPEFVLRHLPDGTPVRLGAVADLYESEGPYEIRRDNGERRIAVQFNSRDRDLAELVGDVERQLTKKLALEPGLRFEMAGRYASAIAAARRMSYLALAAAAAISLLLYAHFRSAALTAQILLNLPFAFIGGVFALWLADTPLSIASFVGFIALGGIATRNGILMISHFEHLMRIEGAPFSAETIIRGALERLTPVLMTAGTAILALAPILVSGPAAPGKEILFPVALIISGGLCSSTLLDLMITPVLYYRLAQRWKLFPEGAER